MDYILKDSIKNNLIKELEIPNNLLLNLITENSRLYEFTRDIFQHIYSTYNFWVGGKNMTELCIDSNGTIDEIYILIYNEWEENFNTTT